MKLTWLEERIYFLVRRRAELQRRIEELPEDRKSMARSIELLGIFALSFCVLMAIMPVFYLLGERVVSTESVAAYFLDYLGPTLEILLYIAWISLWFYVIIFSQNRFIKRINTLIEDSEN